MIVVIAFVGVAVALIMEIFCLCLAEPISVMLSPIWKRFISSDFFVVVFIQWWELFNINLIYVIYFRYIKSGYEIKPSCALPPLHRLPVPWVYPQRTLWSLPHNSGQRDQAPWCWPPPKEEIRLLMELNQPLGTVKADRSTASVSISKCFWLFLVVRVVICRTLNTILFLSLFLDFLISDVSIATLLWNEECSVFT